MAVSLPRAAEARLSGIRSQQVFDGLLRTLAEPGTIRALPAGLPASVPSVAWLPLALADVDITLAVADCTGVGGTPETEALTRLLVEATGGDPVPLAEAWLVAVLPDSTGGTRRLPPELATGSALAPEDGARVALPVRSLTAGQAEASATDACALEAGTGTDHTETSNAVGNVGSDRDSGLELRLRGPGVAGTRLVTVRGLDPAVAAALGTATGSFPAGFDAWLFADDGHLMALSRTTTITIGPPGHDFEED